MEHLCYPELNKLVHLLELDGEDWKPIQGFGDVYMVSNYGRVKSIARTVRTRNQTTAFNVRLETRIIKANCDSRGYPQVKLTWKGNKRVARVHRLVAEAFITNLENKPQVNHKDSNTLNARVENLEWCTASENLKHAYDSGGKVAPLGEFSPNSRLTPEIVTKIYLDAKHRVSSQEKIGGKYGVPQITVSNIKTKKTWRHITDALD